MNIMKFFKIWQATVYAFVSIYYSMEPSYLKSIIDRIAGYISGLKSHFEEPFVKKNMMYYFKIRNTFILLNFIK